MFKRPVGISLVIVLLSDYHVVNVILTLSSSPLIAFIFTLHSHDKCNQAGCENEQADHVRQDVMTCSLMVFIILARLFIPSGRASYQTAFGILKKRTTLWIDLLEIQFEGLVAVTLVFGLIHSGNVL